MIAAMAPKKHDLRNTRSKDTCLQILDDSPGPQHLEITGNKLPNGNQVLLCYIANLEKLRREGVKNKSHKRVASSIVAKQIALHYAKADVPIRSPDNVCNKIEALYDRYRSCSRTKTAASGKNVLALRRDLCLTMPFWPRDVIKLMENRKKGMKDKEQRKKVDEDIDFLMNMMDERTAQYTSVDMVTAKKKKKCEDKMVKYNERKQKETERLNMSKVLNDKEIDQLLNDEENDYDADESQPINFEPPMKKPRLHRRCVKTGETIFIPPDVLNSPLLVANALRNKISATAQSSWFHDFIVTIGGDPSKYCLSHSTVHK